MSERIDCSRFRDRLDDLVEGAIAPEEEDRLRRHARACPDCGMQLRVREHLAGPSREELERAVPGALVESMWPALQVGLPPAARAAPRASQARGWLIPTLAAASLLLLLGNGYLLMEVGRLQERSAALASRLERQERQLGELPASVPDGPRARTATLAGSGWRRALARRETMSVGEMRSLLAALPSSTTLIDPDRAGDLAGGFLRRPELIGASSLSEQDLADGVQAGELLRLLDALEIDPRRRFEVSRLLEVYDLAPTPGAGGL